MDTTKRHLLACLHRQFNEPVGSGDPLLEDEDMRNDNSVRFAILVGTFCRFLHWIFTNSVCALKCCSSVLPRCLRRSVLTGVCVYFVCVTGCPLVNFLHLPLRSYLFSDLGNVISLPDDVTKARRI